jgi:hypothetical protein
LDSVRDWKGRPITVGKSSGGVYAVADYRDNLISGGVAPWPPPELIQKLYQSIHENAFPEAEKHIVTRMLSYYTDLQSLRSEDALTWSLFGPLIYSDSNTRNRFADALLAQIDIPANSAQHTSIWLWRRLPHPDTRTPGGPEVDFGIQTDEVLVIGEAKWLSGVAKQQGKLHDKDQLTLRREFCQKHGGACYAGYKKLVILGVDQAGSSFEPACSDEIATDTVCTRNLTWKQVCGLVESPHGEELRDYLQWKQSNS